MLLSMSRESHLLVEVGGRRIPDLPGHHDEYPKESCGCELTVPSKKEALSDRSTRLTGRTLKIRRILSRSRPQAAIICLSSFAWKEGRAELGLTISFWIVATVLELKLW